MFDSKLHYKHRTNATALNWGWYAKNGGRKKTWINSYGHNDHEFPLKKRDGEIRGLMLGDSVTMGHGVDFEDTFSNFLERKINKYYNDQRKSQIINTGVQGYATYQELEVLKRSLKFKPDFIVLGFCMNDVSEPYVVNKDWGGTGIDYHGVQQYHNPFIGWLLNETGYAKLFKKMKWKYFSKSISKKEAQRWEVYAFDRMSSNLEDPLVKESWDLVAKDIQKMSSIAKNLDIPMLLVVMPYTLQIHNSKKQLPNKILKNIAKESGIDFIDLTLLWEKKIKTKEDIRKYFIDSDHYTEKGHEIIADHLFEWLKEKKIVS